ncbi:uncharacterized protein LOC103376754 isoform X2 [Cynoglossus semilaevis]|uniref:uncharacterized protein LOC103376754 isoform X2 n=1 Tax=Cynoglossus semilaevis TaxID=244447 RepID=UPI000496431F|nr:uncharacterized protein LOC103376754 isoform X2 [Cynoglossus semilaevis]
MSTLVLFTVSFVVMMVSGQENVDLDDTEKRIYIAFGSSLALHCKLETRNYARFLVQWFFIPSTTNESLSIFQRVVTKEIGTEMTHTVSNVTLSGRYKCSVKDEITLLSSNCSKTAHVTFTTESNNLLGIDWGIWIISSVSLLILILLLVLCLTLRTCQRSRGEEPIYANTRPVANRQPSPRVGTLTTNPKTVPSSMNHWTSGTTGRKYEQSTRRAKPTGGHRALV